MNQDFSHLDEQGKPNMVHVGTKVPTARSATARAILNMDADIIARLRQQPHLSAKGPVFQTAILAGIMGAKQTGNLIPLCHPIGMDHCQVTIEIISDTEIQVDCTAEVFAKTGVEMEALTGASVAALTIYDMCKALSHDIVIQDIKLMRKTGGKRDFVRAG